MAGKGTKMEKGKKSLFFAAVVFSLFMSSFVLAINDPVAHWKLDETSGLIAEDSAGDNDGNLINGPNWTTGLIDGALEFDGVDDYVNLSDNAVTTTEFTVAAWANHYGLGGGWNMNVVFSQRDAGVGNNKCAIILKTEETGLAQAVAAIRSSIGSVQPLYAPKKDYNEWHHYAMTVDSTDFIFYIDGVEVNRTTNNQAGDYVTAIDYVDIGRAKSVEGTKSIFNGAIDDVIIYGRALSAAEIEGLYLGEEAELVGLEITGPDEVAEDSQTQYSAIALYDNDSTADVTDDAVWSVEPNVIADIEAGLLTTEKIFQPEELEIYAQYTEDGNIFEADKAVSVFAICPEGTALEFDGVDDYVDVGDPPDGSLDFGADESFSIAAWIKCDDVGGHSAIVGKRRCTGLHGYFYEGYGFRVISDGTLYFGIEDTGNNGVSMYGNTAVADNQWHHVVAVRNATANKLYLYVDGNSDAESVTDSTSGSLSTAQDLWIGLHRTTVSNNPAENPHYFSGLMDEVCIYNRALSAQEIQMIMHIRPEGSEPNLVGYWDFDEGEGQVAYDTSGNGNDGQLGSSPDIDDSDPNWADSDALVSICTLQELVERNVNEALEIKLNILDEILEALAREDSSLNILDGLFGDVEYGYLNRRDIRRVRQEIHSAIQSEEQAIHSVEKSVDDLEDSLEILGSEDGPPGSNSPNDNGYTNRNSGGGGK